MRNFPKSHVVLACVLALPLTSFLLAHTAGDSTADRFTTELVLASVETPALELSGSPPPDLIEAIESGVVATPSPPVTPPRAAEEAAELTRHMEKVESGDSLALIFDRLGIPARDLYVLIHSGPLAARLKRIFPGHELVFETDADHTLVKLSYSPGRLETLVFERDGDGFAGREITQEPDRTTVYKHATIDHSLFVASQRVGLTDELTMRLAHIFQWDIDFVLDIRKGDEFHVVYEELYLGDELVGYGDILAAEFVNRGKSYQAVLYRNGDGKSDYYSPDGNNMRKAFLRAPVEFTRISSNFNLRRFHPITKVVRPHRGIDYAAPTGTPVLAAGDGRVEIAGRTRANGNYVVLRHGGQFQTKYLHLSGFASGIRRGADVEQGQVIGYVGATGLATGPHLHYEFLVDGVHRNPRTVELPEADPIPEDERLAFEARTAPVLALLGNFKQQDQSYAMAE